MKKIFTLLSLFAFSYLDVNAQITASWTLLASGNNDTLYGVSAPQASICYVAGSNGVIRKTTDGGITWAGQASGTLEDLFAITFTDNLSGYIVGNKGTALKTIDGGGNWSVMSLGTIENFRCVYFTDANTGYIGGGTTSNGKIYKTINAGATWTNLNITTANSVIYSIFFTSPLIGYASIGVSGQIIKTTNGGITWSSPVMTGATNTGPLHFTSANNGFLTGNNGVIRTTADAGASWIGVTSGTTNALGRIDFYDSNNGFIVGGSLTANTGIILNTTNGGTSWSTYTPGTARLLSVDMVNANTGYATGLNGVILKYSSNVGIIENTPNHVSFTNYPNPFSNSTIVDLGDYKPLKSISVEIYDLTGKLIKSIISKNESKIEIERNDLSAGIFLYKVFDGTNYLGSGKMTVK
jgi:photosystem II stability/assembly factor-like uncharacterized protein